MRHPTEGTLRRLLDEPAGVSDADREHIAACPTCLSALAAAHADAAVAGVSMTGDAVADVDAGWRRLTGVVMVEQPRRVAVPATGRRRRSVLRSPLVAVLGVALLLAGAGIAAAADWLPIFRTQQIEPVTITQADMVALPDLSAYGEVEVEESPDVRQVADAAAAQAATGLPVPSVTDLPAGVSGVPVIQVGGQASVVFTFSAAKAAQAAGSATLPPPPPGLDGARFRLVAGPGLVETWSADSGLPGLLVARAVAPVGYSTGVPFEQARDYLLTLPGLPQDLVTQLQAFSGDGTTLPLPLPADMVSASESEVGGVPAQVLTARDGTMTAVIWVQDGIVTAVGGSLSADEALSVARGLQ